MESWLTYLRIAPTSVGFEFAAGLVAFAVLSVASARSNRRTRGRAIGTSQSAVPVTRVAAVSSILILVAWLAGDITVLTTEELVWWRFAAPLVSAAFGTGWLLILVAKRPSTVNVVVPPRVRRTWFTFASPNHVYATVIATLVLLVVTMVAGAASSRDPGGRFSRIALPGGGSASFYGWNYGVPVLAMIAILAALSWLVLHCDSVRPFTRPDLVDEQTNLRRTTGRAVLLPALGACSLCLGGVLMFLGGTGIGRTGTDVDGEVVMWGTGFSAFGPALLWAGWVLQVAVIAALMMLSAGLFRSRRPRTSSPVNVRSNL